MHRPLPIRGDAASVGGTGLFQAKGQHWRQEHRLMVRALAKSTLKESMSVMKEMAQRLVQKWHGQVQENGQGDKSVGVHINRDLEHSAADWIGRMAMGCDFDLLNQPNSRMGADIDAIGLGVIQRSLCPFPFWRIPVVGPYLDALGWSIQRVQTVIQKAIDDHVANLQQCSHGYHRE